MIFVFSVLVLEFTFKLLYEGPEKELLQLGVFRELLALFPGVQIYLNLVGPSIPQFRLVFFYILYFVIS